MRLEKYERFKKKQSDYHYDPAKSLSKLRNQVRAQLVTDACSRFRGR